MGVDSGMHRGQFSPNLNDGDGGSGEKESKLEKKMIGPGAVTMIPVHPPPPTPLMHTPIDIPLSCKFSLIEHVNV